MQVKQKTVMEALKYAAFDYAHTTDENGIKYLHHRTGKQWRVAYTMDELEPGVVGFYAGYNEVEINLRQICQFTDLKVLVLIFERIDSLPAEIGQLTQLTTLSLWDNPLTALPAEIGNLTNLSDLSLSGKDFSHFDCSPFVHLERLSFSGSPFWLLPQNLHRLPKLNELDLSDCELHHIPVEIKSLEVNALTLDLQGNDIPEEEVEALRQERPGWGIIMDN